MFTNVSSWRTGGSPNVPRVPGYLKTLIIHSWFFSWWSWNFVCSIGYWSATKSLQMMILCWSLIFLREGELWFLLHLYGETLKWWTEVYDIKVGIYTKLAHREKHVPDANVILWLFSKVTHISLIANNFCPEATGETKFTLHIEHSWDKVNQINWNMVTWPRWPLCTYIAKQLLKCSF